MKTNAIIRIILFTLGILILGSILLVALGIRNYSFRKESFESSYSDRIIEAGGTPQTSEVEAAAPINLRQSQQTPL